MTKVSSHELSLTPAGVLRVILGISAILVILHLIGLYFRLGLGHDYVFGFVPLFDLNSEQNAPTLFSSILLIGASALCSFAGWIVTRWRWRWWLIALIFLILGVDETFGLHEPVFFVLRGNESAGTAGWVARLNGLRWADMLPWLLVIGALVIGWYWSFVRHVGPRISILAVVAASVYLLGAVGFDELASAEKVENMAPAIVVALTTFEEVFELVGASLIIYSIMRYLAEKTRLSIDLVP